MPVDPGDDHARRPIVAPRLDADRWLLRPLETGDAAFILRTLSDPAMRRARSDPPPASEAEAQAWVARAQRSQERGTYVPWIMVAPNGRRIGLAVLQSVDLDACTAEAGYYVSPLDRGRGAATAALVATSGWAFAELGLHRISLLHDVDNLASCRVALAAGFRIEGVLRESRRRLDGSWVDEELHARLARDEAPPARARHRRSRRLAGP